MTTSAVFNKKEPTGKHFPFWITNGPYDGASSQPPSAREVEQDPVDEVADLARDPEG